VNKRQYEHAIAEAEQAITLDPNRADSYVALGSILNLAGQAEKAIGLLEKAMRLDPHYPVTNLSTSGWAYLLTRRYEEAIAT